MASYPNPRRRANGEGTIYHLPAENRWRAALTWTDEAGKRHRRVVSGKTQADVRQRLGAAPRRPRSRPRARPHRYRSAPSWPAGSSARSNVSGPPPGAAASCTSAATSCPALGTVTLAKLTPADVERMTADLIASGRSPRTASHARVTLRRALSDAVRDGLVHRNVAALARPPRVPRRTIEPGRDYLDASQLRRLLAVATEYRVGALVTLAATTGLRQGELLGLSWDDVDGQAGRSPSAAAWRARGAGATNSPSRRRAAAGAPSTCRRWRSTRSDARSASSPRRARLPGRPGRTGTGLVFTDAVGRPLLPDAVHRAFRELLEARPGCPGSRSTACATPRRRRCCRPACRCASCPTCSGTPASPLPRLLRPRRAPIAPRGRRRDGPGARRRLVSGRELTPDERDGLTERGRARPAPRQA